MPPSSLDPSYADRLSAQNTLWWKRLLDVQRPYRAHLRQMKLGRVLDVGCGLGRNLKNLGGNAIGIDANVEMVARCKAAGWEAFTPAEFAASAHAREGAFDALLLAHVVEHMPAPEARQLVATYLPYIRHGGRVVLITPQEMGFRGDPTHVTFFDLTALRGLAGELGLEVLDAHSFPFPRFAGRLFRYNEFVLVARKL